MLNYSDIKAYWSKFYADAFEDAKTIAFTNFGLVGVSC
jgi:hypothetical protein